MEKTFSEEKLAVFGILVHVNESVYTSMNNKIFLNTQKNTINNYICKQHTQFWKLSNANDNHS